MLLITGITGHSGKHFLKELIDNAYKGKIRCIVRESSDTTMLDSSGLDIEKVTASLDDQKALDEAMIGIDTVMHIGSIFYSVYVIKAAVKNNVKRAIFVHTTGIYSKYKSASEEYAQIEKRIDNIIKKNNSDIGLVYLRPTMIYGYLNDRNMIIFIKMVDRLRIFPVINHGKNLLQPVNGRDLGKAYYQVINSSVMNGDYILSGDKPVSMLQMFKLISKYLNKKTVFINVPMEAGVFLARLLKFFTLNRTDYIEKVQRMGEDRHFDHSKAKKDFGYNPIPFSEGLKMEVQEYLRQDK